MTDEQYDTLSNLQAAYALARARESGIYAHSTTVREELAARAVLSNAKAELERYIETLINVENE